MADYKIEVLENGQLTAEAKVISLLKRKKEIEKEYKKLKDLNDAFKKAMKENGVKTAEFEADGTVWRITYTPNGTRKNVDTEKLKRDGIYDNYTKAVQTGDRLTITTKEVEEDDDEEE